METSEYEEAISEERQRRDESERIAELESEVSRLKGQLVVEQKYVKEYRASYINLADVVSRLKGEKTRLENRVLAVERAMTDGNAKWFQENVRLRDLVERLTKMNEQLVDENTQVEVDIAKVREALRWRKYPEEKPEEMDHYLCLMEEEPDLGRRIDVVFYAIRGPGSMAIKETGWGKPFLYGWANHEVLYWRPLPTTLPVHPIPPIQEEK